MSETVVPPFSVIISKVPDILIMERYIRMILKCTGTYCSFLQSAEYISLKHSILRWLTRQGQTQNEVEIKSEERQCVHISNSAFSIYKTVVGSDVLLDPTQLSIPHVCMIIIKENSQVFSKADADVEYWGEGRQSDDDVDDSSITNEINCHTTA